MFEQRKHIISYNSGFDSTVEMGWHPIVHTHASEGVEMLQGTGELGI